MSISPEEWLIDQIMIEASILGTPLGEEVREILRSDVRQLDPDDGVLLLLLNNRVVEIARSAMERSKRNGSPTTRPRRGLRIPTDWFDAYTKVFTNNSPAIISSIMQSAMMMNPQAGERKMWKSK